MSNTSKQVRERANAGASIVLNKKGEHVATVQFLYTQSAVQCDVWARPAGGRGFDLVHQHKAGGYGYDKGAAALSGAVIDGYRMADHCGRVEEAGEKKREALFKAYSRESKGLDSEALKLVDRYFEAKASKIGCRFANWGGMGGTGYASLHNLTGLGRLEALGYTVINAL